MAFCHFSLDFVKDEIINLLWSTFSNLLIYLMSLLRLPKGVGSKLEKVQTDFPWGSSSSERKIHLLNWKTVCSSKGKGGLGIRNLVVKFIEEESSTR